MDWISVKDRLPEPLVDVLAYRPIRSPSRRCITIEHVTEGSHWLFDWLGSVSHWMPLPAPPKEAEHG